METNLKNIMKKVAVVSAATSVMLMSSVTPAVAAGDTGGGGDNDHNAGGASSSQSWVSVIKDGTNKDGTSKTWDLFLKKAHWGNTISRLKDLNVNLKVCQTSSVIWYLANSKDYWSSGYQGYTHGPIWNGNANRNGSIEKPYKALGDRKVTQREVDNIIKWDKEENGHRIDKSTKDSKGGYTVLCSGPDRIAPPPIITLENGKTTSNKESISFTEPYSWTTDVTRQISKSGKDPIGVDNLHNQSGTPIKSNFGKLWDKYNTSKDQEVKNLKQQVEAALEKDKTIDHSKLSLDQKNQEGMAEGGVLNVNERTQYATLNTTKTTKNTVIMKCTTTFTWDDSKNDWKANKKCAKDTTKTEVSYTANKSQGTLKNTGFWQMLSVHCNQAQFNELINSDNTLKVVNTGDATKAISAVVNTKKYASQPKVLDFGDSRNTNAAKKKTADLAFYNKECPFDCTPVANTTGASSENGATSNVINGKGTVKSVRGGKYGVVSSDITNNSFEFFRDNKDQKLVADVWYPKDNAVVKYNGAKPLTTTVTRDASGTPGVASNNGGQFTMTTKSGKKLFTGSTAAKTQMNWDVTTFSNSTATILPGLEREFNVKSTWASEDNRPQIINIKWEYAPSVGTKVNAVNIGFGSGSSQKLGSTKTLVADIQGKCYANFGTNAQKSTIDAFQQNTGSGTTNNLDGKLFESATGLGAKDKQTNLVLNFVRSTTE